MFKIGEKIVYGMSGIYTVEDIREETVLGQKRTYYILQSEGNMQSKVFVPVDSETLVASMRRTMSREDAEKIISEVKDIPEAPWQKDSRQRSSQFRAIMESGDPRAVISVIKSLWKNSEARKAEGKKTYMADENSMRKAEKLLYSELSLALGIPEDQVLSYIIEKC